MKNRFHTNQENLKYFRVRKDFFLGERDREHWHKKSPDDFDAIALNEKPAAP